jgi:hypothetical protein
VVPFDRLVEASEHYCFALAGMLTAPVLVLAPATDPEQSLASEPRDGAR